LPADDGIGAVIASYFVPGNYSFARKASISTFSITEWLAHPMKIEVSFHPPRVGQFGVQAVVPQAQTIPELVQKLGGAGKKPRMWSLLLS